MFFVSELPLVMPYSYKVPSFYIWMHPPFFCALSPIRKPRRGWIYLNKKGSAPFHLRDANTNTLKIEAGYRSDRNSREWAKLLCNPSSSKYSQRSPIKFYQRQSVIILLGNI